MGGIDRGPSWMRPAAIGVGTAVGVGLAAHGASKAYQAYNKAQIIKETAAMMNNSSKWRDMVSAADAIF